ncbi:ferritin-like domain-containing protein [Paroceanicella profunda]|uniref:Ferritin-like domain-containing protein n=1 Tax=Paroceanicella profunda TaxID=2579971 RepID=A0A5B8FZ48_9RHOB|nr:ferritin-like domain-containing protein [Paroceanicella profunda]
MPQTVSDCAVAVLTTAGAREKAALSRRLAAHWRDRLAAGTPLPMGTAAPPDTPARPARPELLSPRDMPRRRPGSAGGRLALLHAIAHIELNAIDLHWDVLARFSHVPMPAGFAEDWVRAADDESKHFNLLADRLEAFGSAYGAFPAHAGLWRSAEMTAHDLPARLAVVPMVLEARGLDVTPGMIEAFTRAGDVQTVAALEVIYADEVAHVAYGSKWFHFLCGREDLDPKIAFHDLVRRHFGGALKPPFNEAKRADAGLPPDFYWPLAADFGQS